MVRESAEIRARTLTAVSELDDWIERVTEWPKQHMALDRSYRAFLRAARVQPGNLFRLAALAAMAASIGYRRGPTALLVILGIVIMVVAGPGYLAWRRWGEDGKGNKARPKQY